MDSNTRLVFVILSQYLEVDVRRAASIACLTITGSVAQALRQWLWKARIAQKAAQKWKLRLADIRIWRLSEEFAREWMFFHGLPGHWHTLMAQWTPYSASFILDRNFNATPWSDLMGNHLQPHAVHNSYVRFMKAFKIACMLSKAAGDWRSFGIVEALIVRLQHIGLLGPLRKDADTRLMELDPLDSSKIVTAFGNTLEDSIHSDDNMDDVSSIDSWERSEGCNIEAGDWIKWNDPDPLDQGKHIELADECWPEILHAALSLPAFLPYVVMMVAQFNMGDFSTSLMFSGNPYGHWERLPFQELPKGVVF